MDSMSDPSSFAETPLAPLRKLAADFRQEADNWRRCVAAEAVLTDADYRAQTYDTCANKLSALLTDLEAAVRARREEKCADDEYFKSGTRYPGQ